MNISFHFYICVVLFYTVHYARVLAIRKLEICVQTKEQLEEEIKSPSVTYSTMLSPFTINQTVTHQSGDKYCFWKFYVSGYMKLEFTEFDLNDDPGCRKEYVQIIQPDKSRGRKFCGKSFPKELIYDNNVIKMIFYTDSSRNGSHFTLAVSEGNKRCSGVNSYQVDNNPSYLYSPGYPSSYFSYLNCYWQLWNTNQSEVIMLEFLSFFLQDQEPSCSSDYLKISAGSIRKVMCGYHERFMIRISDHLVYLLMKTDGLISAKGFLIRYYSLPDYPETCSNSTVVKLKASRNKPRFVRTSTIDCSWEITPDIATDVIIVQVLSANENEYDINRRYFIKERLNVDIVQYIEVPGEVMTYYRSATNHITVKNINNNITTRSKIFSFSFHSIPKDLFTEEKILVDGGTANIYIPPINNTNSEEEQPTVYLTTNQDCVQASLLNTDRTELDKPLTNYFQFYDGKSTDSDLLEGICVGYTNSISGHYKNMVIRRKNNSTDSKGFWLIVKRTEFCNGVTMEIDLTHLKNIYSPGYPQPLIGKMFCQWRILRKSSDDNLIGLFTYPSNNQTAHTDHSDHGDSSPECTTGLTINYDIDRFGRPVNLYWCMKTEEQFNFDRDDILLTVQSNNSLSVIPPFKLTISRISDIFANGPYKYYVNLKSNQSFEIVSPYFHGGYVGEINCRWTIELENRFDVVNFTLIQFNADLYSNCILLYLRVYNDDFTTATSRKEYCKRTTLPITSMFLEPTIKVDFQRQFSGYSSGFKAIVTSTDISVRCNEGWLKADNEIRYLVATNRNSPIGDFCYFHLDLTDSLQELTIEVVDFNLPDCTTDSVTFYDGETVSDKKLGTVCRNPVYNSKIFTSSTGHILIHFRSSASKDVNGFKLKYYSRYKEVTSWMLRAQTYSQYFTSPNYPSSYGRNRNYTWHINTAPGERVKIEVLVCYLGNYYIGRVDKVNVYDGAKIDEYQLIRTFTNNIGIPSLESSKSNMVVQLISGGNDFYKNKRIRIKYSQVYRYPTTTSSDSDSSASILASTLGVVTIILAVIVFSSCCCVCYRRQNSQGTSVGNQNLHLDTLQSPQTPASDLSAPPPDYSETQTWSVPSIPSPVVNGNDTSALSEPPPSYEESSKYEIISSDL